LKKIELSEKCYWKLLLLTRELTEKRKKSKLPSATLSLTIEWLIDMLKVTSA
jgi:hypothetical protein